MTSPHLIDAEQLLADQLAQASPDLLRGLLSTFIAALMGAEADALCGAGYRQRSDERSNSRNGYPSGPSSWPSTVPSISQRAGTPHMTAISLTTNFFGGAPTSRHHFETVARLTSNLSMRSWCLRPASASAI